MTDDLTPLTSANHWLGWLGENPGGAVRGEIERLLRQQVPSASLAWLRITAEPNFLTGGRKSPEDEKKIIVTRAALAVAFELEVRSDDRTDELKGAFSWVAVGLDGAKPRYRVWLDLSTEMPWAAEQLKARIYEIDRPQT
jgi:hypothetical protein